MVKHTFVLFLAISGLVHADASCADCKTRINKLNTYLGSEAGIQTEIILFDQEYCSTVTNFDACDQAMVKYWPIMAKIMFNFSGADEMTCENLGQCPDNVNSE